MNTFLLFTILLLLSSSASAQNCGRQGGNAPCSNGNCCSQWGFCGNTPDHCLPSNNCQYQCTGSSTTNPPSDTVGSIITSSVFDEMLKYRNDPRCRGNGFYAYTAFINAARTYNGFGTTGSAEDRRRELAAFFAQTSHETTGGWPTAPDGPYAWGYCFVREQDQSNRYCDSSAWPCPQSYFGRGPIQLSRNDNYGRSLEMCHTPLKRKRECVTSCIPHCTENDLFYGVSQNAIGRDLINNPDLLATDATLSFQSAIWFWMTPQGNKPSSHNVITRRWTPSAADNAAGRVPGYGVITNIINGGLECGQGRVDPRVESRIGFYRRYCSMLGVSPGDNLDCYNQRHFG